jgi:hypothetical protein
MLTRWGSALWHALACAIFGFSYVGAVLPVLAAGAQRKDPY